VTTDDIPESRISAVTSLKEIVTLLAAIAFTVGISTLLAGFNSAQPGPITSIPITRWVNFTLLLVGLLRFYHGNVSFLDQNYVLSSNRGGMPSDKRRNFLAVDFVAVLIVALLFTALGFTLKSDDLFQKLYISIIGFDVLWLGLTARGLWGFSQGWFRINTSGNGWFWNNVIHLALVLAVPAILQLTGDQRYGVIAVLLGTNAAFDFALSWPLYFPPSTGPVRRVFLAAPFTQLIPRNGEPLPDVVKSRLLSLIHVVEHEFNLQVHCAHQRERWGQDLDPPGLALERDIDEITRADVLVAILGSPPSPGVQFELGYAIALGKRILILKQKDQFVPYLNRDLDARANIRSLAYERDEEVTAIVRKYLETVSAQRSTR
jgi:nucleoside 2-deoxyribosyltransferase